MSRSRRIGFLYVLIAGLCWGMMGTLSKVFFKSGMSPFDLVQVRVTGTALVLGLIFLAFSRQYFRIDRKDIGYFLILGTAGTALNFFTYFYAISKIPVAVAILLEFLAPSFIAVYSILFLRERVSGVVLIAIFLSLAGVFFAVEVSRFSLGAEDFVGVLAGLAAAITFSIYTLKSEYGVKKYPVQTVLLYGMTAAALFWNIFHFPLSSFRYFSTMDGATWCLSTIFLGTVIPVFLFLRGVQMIRPTFTAMTATIEPISAAWFSFLILGEVLSASQIFGGVMVLTAIFILQKEPIK